MNNFLEAQRQASQFSGANAAYLEALYETFLDNPEAVPAHWRQVFGQLLNGQDTDTRHLAIRDRFEALGLTGSQAAAVPAELAADAKQAGVLRMINAYRVRGHQKAKLDPLNLSHRPDVPDLTLAFHGLDPSDLDTQFHTGSLAAPDHLTLREIVGICEATYCGSIGSEYMHITDTNQRRWLQQRLEGVQGEFRPTPDKRRRLLEKLAAAEGLEKYLHSKYVGQKRFSLEGAESMIPMLDTLIQHKGHQGIKEMVIGMAHRGRLNVLVNIIGKRPGELFAEFEGGVKSDDPLRSGDVKYHMGYSSDVETPGGTMHLALAFNPSHLEIVNPVVVGSARARQTRRHDFQHLQVIPVLIHGDAAIAGQGVVMELFNMSQARGFNVGGTFHIVVNNQIGFTTSNPLDARSTLYCTEVAKMVQAPIFHVNADDPEAVAFITKVAADFRREFKKDVVIDLVCYRRHGHNEADEPAATQPRMYQVIRSLPSVRKQYADRLIAEGVVDAAELDAWEQTYRQRLDQGEPVIELLPDGDSVSTVDWTPYLNTSWRDTVDTSVAPERIRELSDRLTTLPDGFKLHRQVERIIDARRKMAAGEIPMDWGFAETMAYATLLEEDYSLRLDGQDTGRGTFFHRHSVLYDRNTGQPLVPLAELAGEPQKAIVIDSLLSEEAVMAFEYGYATADPQSLVIWEAQFGDFFNGAQVVVDQFISSGEAKWGRLCGLTLFLPHGYEGQGPEHSSARLERFMQLCSGDNMQVCVPTTPAQMFHMLRRQMLRPWRRPLVVMTPKSLLRHKSATSTLDELAQDAFQLVIDDGAIAQPGSVKRLIFCAGKVYYDLLQARDAAGTDDVALVRIEQLYPFPREEVSSIVERYKHITDVVWCQEEPMNQGAWYHIRHHLQACIGEGQTLSYVGRESSAAPAVGYYQLHVEQQKQLVEQALSTN